MVWAFNIVLDFHEICFLLFLRLTKAAQNELHLCGTAAESTTLSVSALSFPFYVPQIEKISLTLPPILFVC